MKAIILAAGIGSRMKKYTKNLKKKEIRIIYGGFERFDSTFNALNYIKKKSPKKKSQNPPQTIQQPLKNQYISKLG